MVRKPTTDITAKVKWRVTIDYRRLLSDPDVQAIAAVIGGVVAAAAALDQADCVIM